MDERAEESAAEVLARLEQYVAASRARRTADPLDTAFDARPDSNTAPVDTLIPAHDGTRLRQRRFGAWRGQSSTGWPALIAVTICSFVILLSVWFDAGVAVVIGGALMLVGVVGLVHRVPLARAYTFGLVVAALLIRLS